DISHAGVGGNVVAAYHDVAAGIDVQPLENERTGHLVGVEVGGRIGGARAVKRGVRAPSQELALDQVVHADAVDPEFLDGVDIDAGLHNRGSDDLGAVLALVAHRQHAAGVVDENVPFEAFADDGVGSRIARIDRKLDHVDAGFKE